MPKFRIEQYELHVLKYEIEAATEAEAIVKLLDGEAEPVDGSLEFVEVAEDFGLPVDENRQLAEELSALGVPVGDHIIPSIRNIEEVE
jgi:hypothetical protein